MLKILHIEDEINFRRNVCDMLADEGFSTIEASNGEEALEIINKEEPDLIISDITIPKLSGFDVLKKLRSDRQSMFNTPFIFLTGSKENESIVNGTNLFPDDYLVKPVSFKVLLAKINAALYRARVNSSIRSLIYNATGGEEQFVHLRSIVEAVTGFLKKDKEHLSRPIIVNINDDLPKVSIDQKYFLKALENLLCEVLERTSDGVVITSESDYASGKITLKVSSKTLNYNKCSDIAEIESIRSILELQGIKLVASNDNNLQVIIPAYRVENYL
jgi:DNA-binding response OmpR family regulator